MSVCHLQEAMRDSIARPALEPPPTNEYRKYFVLGCFVSQENIGTLASFPGSPRMWICICGESLVSFVCNNQIVAEQKGNALRIIQLTMRSCTIKVSVPPLYLWRFLCDKKNTRLSTPAQLQCLRSKVWEPGNEAIWTQPEYYILFYHTSNSRKCMEAL